MAEFKYEITEFIGALKESDSHDWVKAITRISWNDGPSNLDIRNINARIEPGCFIRENVTIGDNAVIMMGAVKVLGNTPVIIQNLFVLFLLLYPLYYTIIRPIIYMFKIRRVIYIWTLTIKKNFII